MKPPVETFFLYQIRRLRIPDFEHFEFGDFPKTAIVKPVMCHTNLLVFSAGIRPARSLGDVLGYSPPEPEP